LGGRVYPRNPTRDPIHMDVWSGDLPSLDRGITMLMLASRKYVLININTVGVTVGAELTPLTQLVTVFI